MAPKSVAFRQHDHLVSVLFGDLLGVSIHWTGLLEWNTGLDYWNDLCPFL